MQTVLVFSANNNLFNTVISREVESLSSDFNVVLLLEDRRVISSGVKTEHYYKYSKPIKEFSLLKNLSSLQSFKKYAKFVARKYAPSIVVIHSDEDFDVNLFVYCLKRERRNIKVLLRRPSMCVDLQTDFRWMKYQYRFPSLASSILFVKKNYFDLFLMTLATGRPRITRTRFFHTNSARLANRKSRIYDSSLCYSYACRRELAKAFEQSTVIKFEPREREAAHNKGSALIAPSNDIESIQFYKGLKRKDAEAYYVSRILDVVNDIRNICDKIFIKFKSEFDQKIFESMAPLSVIRSIEFLPSKDNIYDYIYRFEYVVGFTTTILWQLSLENSTQKLISYELLDVNLYKYFSNIENVSFIPTDHSLGDDVKKGGVNRDYGTRLPTMQYIINSEIGVIDEGQS